MVAYNRIFVDGTMGDTAQESWCIGVAFKGLSGGTVQSPTDLNQWCADIATYFGSASLPGMLNMLSSSARITKIRAYFYPGAGPAVSAGEATLVTAKAGTGTAAKPPQAAAVFTLGTLLVGRRYRGRFYWPWLGTGFTGATLKGQVPGGTAAEAAAMLTAIGQAAPGGEDFEPVIYSAVADVVTPVTSVRVGDVVDTQRRRRDNLVETYQTAPV